jgi:hypothetical protein
MTLCNPDTIDLRSLDPKVVGSPVFPHIHCACGTIVTIVSHKDTDMLKEYAAHVVRVATTPLWDAVQDVINSRVK